MQEHNGNKTLAVRSLQISRAYLHRLLRNAEQELDQEPDRPKLEPRVSAASPESGPATTPARISLLRRVFSFPVMIACLLAVLAVLTVRGRFDDPDMWLHLKTGQIIWTTHHIPTTDTFSWTTHHHATIPHEWLAQTLIYAAYHFPPATPA